MTKYGRGPIFNKVSITTTTCCITKSIPARGKHAG
jgi:hypothetical protein